MTRESAQAIAPIAAETLLEIASGLALAADAWTHSPERHRDARTGQRILATEGYDVWVLRWPAGTSVSPHHHGDSDAAFVVSSGTLEETRWRDGRREVRQLTRGQGATVERGVVHDVAAHFEALSVHVYSPPLGRMTYFDDLAERVVLEEPVDPRHAAVFGGGAPQLGILVGSEKSSKKTGSGSARGSNREILLRQWISEHSWSTYVQPNFGAGTETSQEQSSSTATCWSGDSVLPAPPGFRRPRTQIDRSSWSVTRAMHPAWRL